MFEQKFLTTGRKKSKPNLINKERFKRLFTIFALGIGMGMFGLLGGDEISAKKFNEVQARIDTLRKKEAEKSEALIKGQVDQVDSKSIVDELIENSPDSGLLNWISGFFQAGGGQGQ